MTNQLQNPQPNLAPQDNQKSQDSPPEIPATKQADEPASFAPETPAQEAAPSPPTGAATEAEKPVKDPAIDIRNTFKPEQGSDNQTKPPAQKPPEKEEVKDLFEEGLEFEPEPEKTPKEPSMQDIRPQAPPSPETKPQEPTPPGPPENSSALPPEEQEALNKIHGTRLSDLGIHAPQSQPSGGPPASGAAEQPPKKRSFCGLIVGILILLLVLGGGAYAYFAFFAKVALTISLNVDGVEVVVDDQSYTSQVTNNQLKLSLSPGIHKFKLSKDDYFTYEKSLNVAKITDHHLKIELRPYPEPLQLLQYKASDLSADFENGYIYYRSNGGKTLYYVELESDGKGGKAQSITPDIMAPVKQIVWSPDHNYAILKVIQGSAVSGTPFAGQSSPENSEMTFLYDLADLDKTRQSAFFLGDNIGDLKWAGSSNLYFVQDNKVLKTDKALSSFETILDFNDEGLVNPRIFISKNESYLALISQSGEYSSNDVVLFNTESKEVSKITDDGNKLRAKFNSDENILLFSTYDQSSNYKEKIDAYLLSSQALQSLNIQTKLSKACFSAANTVLYAEYNESSKTDDLKALYLSSDTTTQYKYLGKEVEFSELWFDETSEYLYFINKDLIYSLKLDDGEY